MQPQRSMAEGMYTPVQHTTIMRYLSAVPAWEMLLGDLGTSQLFRSMRLVCDSFPFVTLCYFPDLQTKTRKKKQILSRIVLFKLVWIAGPRRWERGVLGLYIQPIHHVGRHGAPPGHRPALLGLQPRGVPAQPSEQKICQMMSDNVRWCQIMCQIMSDQTTQGTCAIKAYKGYPRAR